jgi:hypothetical protein
MTSEERFAALERRLATVESQLEAQKPVDLSDRYADFTIRKSPPQWLQSGGHDFAGQPISTTSPEFCDAIASFLDWQASKDEEQGKTYVNAKGVTVAPAVYARKDAARARAWATRLRENRRTPVAAPGAWATRLRENRRTPVAAPGPRRQSPAAPAQPTFGDYGSDDEIPF